jgi:formate-dependent nitrite reductase membrane component NrfD
VFTPLVEVQEAAKVPFIIASLSQIMNGVTFVGEVFFFLVLFTVASLSHLINSVTRDDRRREGSTASRGRETCTHAKNHNELM